MAHLVVESAHASLHGGQQRAHGKVLHKALDVLQVGLRQARPQALRNRAAQGTVWALTEDRLPRMLPVLRPRPSSLRLQYPLSSITECSAVLCTALLGVVV